jgi:hypothetical protein
MHRLARPLGALLLGAAATAASAQSTPVGTPLAPADAGPWRVGASLYFYVPTVSGKTRVPADSGGTTLTSTILEHLKFTFMGSLDAHNGRWGAFADFIYLDFAATATRRASSRSATAACPPAPRPTSTGSSKAPPGPSAGSTASSPARRSSLDALAGARWLDIKRSSDWSITGDLGPLPPASASGQRKDTRRCSTASSAARPGDASARAALVGAVLLRHRRRRFEAHLAGRAGIRYAFDWGEVSALCRVLDYELKSGDPVEKLASAGRWSARPALVARACRPGGAADSAPGRGLSGGSLRSTRLDRTDVEVGFASTHDMKIR